MKRRLFGFLLTLAAAFAGLCVLVLVFQGRLIYFPGGPPQMDPSLMGLAFEDVEVEAADGVRLHGWWIPAPDAAGTVLFSHGNAGSIEGRMRAARVLVDMGLSVMLYDYRGYGRSEGRPSEEGLYRDAVAFHDHLVQRRGVDPQRLLLYGESLGVAVAIELARRRPVAGLFLESGFTSMADVGAVHYPWLPVGLLLRHRYENEDKIGTLEVPILIIHSPDDELVPFSHAHRLLTAAGGTKELLETAGGHNDGGYLQRAEWQRAVGEWVRRVLGGGAARDDAK